MRSSLFTGAAHEYFMWYKPRIRIHINWMEGCITMFCNGLKLIGLKGMSMWSLFIKFQTCIRDFSVKLPYLFRKWMRSGNKPPILTMFWCYMALLGQTLFMLFTAFYHYCCSQYPVVWYLDSQSNKWHPEDSRYYQLSNEYFDHK